MTDTTLTTDQYAKARRKFHEERRDANRPPTRTHRRIGAPPPPLAGHLTLDGIAEAMGITKCAVYFRDRRGQLPFPIVKRAGHLYARAEDVAPYAANAVANAVEDMKDAA